MVAHMHMRRMLHVSPWPAASHAHHTTCGGRTRDLPINSMASHTGSAHPRGPCHTWKCNSPCELGGCAPGRSVRRQRIPQAARGHSAAVAAAGRRLGTPGAWGAAGESLTPTEAVGRARLAAGCWSWEPPAGARLATAGRPPRALQWICAAERSDVWSGKPRRQPPWLSRPCGCTLARGAQLLPHQHPATGPLSPHSGCSLIQYAVDGMQSCFQVNIGQSSRANGPAAPRACRMRRGACIASHLWVHASCHTCGCASLPVQYLHTAGQELLITAAADKGRCCRAWPRAGATKRGSLAAVVAAKPRQRVACTERSTKCLKFKLDHESA